MGFRAGYAFVCEECRTAASLGYWRSQKPRFCSVRCDKRFRSRTGDYSHRPAANLHNRQFGSWTVIGTEPERPKSSWLCRCSCGTEKRVRAHCLVDGTSRSCRTCAGNQRVDLVGQRFGRLTVIESAVKDSSATTKAYWSCLCDCGTMTVTRTDYLRSGRSKSCGCWLHSTRKPRYESSWNQVYSKLRTFAVRRKDRVLEWTLTREQVIDIVQRPCFYCGCEPSQTRCGTQGRPQDVVRFNSLDRVDSGRGYTAENVVPCCKSCNFAKNTMSVDEFRAWIIRVYDHFVKRREQ